MISIKKLSGLRGVHPDENATAIKFGNYFEIPLLIAAFWIPIQAFLESTGGIDTQVSSKFDWIVWTVFVLEAFVITFLVNDKVRYLRQNWMNVVIILSSLPVLWDKTPITAIMRFVRMVFVMGLLARLFNVIYSVLSNNHLGKTLVLSFVFVIVAGAAIYRVDPAITTIADGIWWALVTVTTVGYGDIVPVSGLGRLFGGLLILLGVVLFSLLTANISAFLVGRDVKKEEYLIIEKIDLLQKQMQNIEKKIDASNDKNQS